MGGAASIHLESNELAELAEQEEYDGVAAIVRDRRIEASTAINLSDKAIEELADDEVTRTSIRTARDEFKEAVSKEPGAGKEDMILSPSRVDDVKQSADAERVLPAGGFCLMSATCDNFVHPQGGTANENVELLFHPGGPEKRLQFVADYVDGGRFYLKSAATGMFVHPQGGTANQNCKLLLHPAGPEKRLLFAAEKTDDGKFLLKSAATGLYVHPHGGNPTTNTKLMFFPGCDRPERLKLRAVGAVVMYGDMIKLINQYNARKGYLDTCNHSGRGGYGVETSPNPDRDGGSGTW